MGEDYRFLLISGANTGGKTVTLKMCGLFCLMAASGLFVPAAEGTTLPVFDQVFCDVGDSQSIEENLSTFSSHVVNLKYILENANEKSFVLIDEPGGGTDPEEGQALARAVLKSLLSAARAASSRRTDSAAQGVRLLQRRASRTAAWSSTVRA